MLRRKVLVSVLFLLSHPQVRAARNRQGTYLKGLVCVYAHGGDASGVMPARAPWLQVHRWGLRHA
jgi:hypothetical protein